MGRNIEGNKMTKKRLVKILANIIVISHSEDGDLYKEADKIIDAYNKTISGQVLPYGPMAHIGDPTGAIEVYLERVLGLRK